MVFEMPHVIDIAPFRSYHPSQHHYHHQQHQPQVHQFICSVPEVLQAGEPLLSKPVPEVPVREIGSCKIERIINDMVAAMMNGSAAGLAAPQIGQALQIIVLEDARELISCTPQELQNRKPSNLMVIINPKLKVINPSETETCFEDCPSINGYRALVKRYSEVEVSGLNRRGEQMQVHAKGWMARVLQHECDHVDGILFVDKMVPRSFRSINSA